MQKICHHRIRPLLAKQCAVCGCFIQCNNYGAPSCQACSDFFRRSVRQKRSYSCHAQQNCQINEKYRAKCRACRFKKCLEVGMKKQQVRMKKKHENKLCAKEKLRMIEKASVFRLIRSQEVNDFNQINFLLKIENNLSRILCSSTELSDTYINQFASLEHLINSNENLLARASEFSLLPPKPWEGDKTRELIQKFGICAYKPIMYRILDHLLTAGLVKVLLRMVELCPNDKSNLFRAIAIPMCTFVSAYYSVVQHSDTVIRSNGLMPIRLVGVPRYTSDRIVKILLKNLYSNALKPFQQIQLNREEFVLLLAILLTQSSFATELSRFAHEQLFAECAKYTAILFRLVLRSRPTLGQGLRRFDDLQRLVSHVVWMNNYYDKYATYMDAVHFKGERKAMMPSAIYQIYSKK